MAQDNRPLVEGKYLEYLDKPLVREDNTICYGDFNEKCVLILQESHQDHQARNEEGTSRCIQHGSGLA